MSVNSIHINNPTDTGASYATHSTIVKAIIKAKGNSPINRNDDNAGFTAFDLRDVFTGYARARGQGNVAARIIGYANPENGASQAIRKRLRNAGPHKLRELHTLMKNNNMVVPAATVGRIALFYTFERLLQLFFEDYEAVEIPQRIRNWVPTEGSFWNHWWKER